jgi:hypothetical protein
MVETVACVSAVSDACTRTEVKLKDVTAAVDIQHEQRTLFEDMAQRAIAKAIDVPHPAGPVAAQRLDLQGAATEIANRKSDLMAPSARVGATAEPTPTTATDEAFDRVSGRIRTLYLDLTEYHVAWKVGHKVQQDISQILKGQ